MQAAFSSGCTGKVATAKSPMQGSGAHVQVICEHANGLREEGSFIVLPRSKGGVYNVVITQAAPPAAPPAASSTLPPAAGPASPAQSPDQISSRLMDASMKVAR